MCGYKYLGVHMRVSVCIFSQIFHMSQSAVISHFTGHWQLAGAHLGAEWRLLSDSFAVLQDSVDLSKWWHQRHSIMCVRVRWWTCGNTGKNCEAWGDVSVSHWGETEVARGLMSTCGLPPWTFLHITRRRQMWEPNCSVWLGVRRL